MNSRRQILTAHYREVLRKAASWAGLVALLGTTIVASPAAAVTQMGARSVTPLTLRASANTTYSYSFKPSVTNAVGSVKFELCTSPLESVGCTTPTGASNAGAGGITLGGQIAGFTIGTGTPPVPVAQTIWITNATPQSLTVGTLSTVGFTGIVNPSTNNSAYYARITTYSSSSGGAGELDFGGFALQTAQDLSVTASVQEALTFCVGLTAAADCSSVGIAAIPLATGSGCSVMSTANVCTGTSQMTAYTNANTGYSITYNGTVFTGPSDTITAIGGTPAASNPGTKQFGLKASVAGVGGGVVSGNYSTANYAFVAATPTVIATVGAATATNTYTVTYAGNVDATTKPGLYTSTFNYVCTGLF